MIVYETSSLEMDKEETFGAIPDEEFANEMEKLSKRLDMKMRENQRLENESIEISKDFGNFSTSGEESYMDRLRKISRPLFVTKNHSTPLREIPYKAKVECNNMIEPKIAQNRTARQKSLIKAANFIVK